ncbi:hypothetical protein ETAA8_27440 [Anatilimnocola aggregata]|uniref:Uncharacterized protein n=1 Tax=Anatilimnocola aggregata TaxID=2528021 RepID=A0A517YBP2_9BACT|nr:hypothetical protein [Anatilimnocola aggregata]QDU27655.1 hypothetical protein ETAA8_27440 [Anatilimnocola aggregata]
MKPSQELIDDIYRERIERARRTPMEEKMFDGLKLFADACEWARVGLRARFPNESEEQIEYRLRAQLDRLKAIEPNAWTIIPTSEASLML